MVGGLEYCAKRLSFKSRKSKTITSLHLGAFQGFLKSTGPFFGFRKGALLLA